MKIYYYSVHPHYHPVSVSLLSPPFSSYSLSLSPAKALVFIACSTYAMITTCGEGLSREGQYRVGGGKFQANSCVTTGGKEVAIKQERFMPPKNEYEYHNHERKCDSQLLSSYDDHAAEKKKFSSSSKTPAFSGKKTHTYPITRDDFCVENLVFRGLANDDHDMLKMDGQLSVPISCSPSSTRTMHPRKESGSVTPICLSSDFKRKHFSSLTDEPSPDSSTGCFVHRATIMDRDSVMSTDDFADDGASAYPSSKFPETPTNTTPHQPSVLCQVCGDLAAGFYCSAYICDACKVCTFSYSFISTIIYNLYFVI